MPRWLEPLAWWVILVSVYLALISTVSLTEILVAAVTAAACAAAAVTARRALLTDVSGGRLALDRRGALTGLARLPAQIVADTVRLARPRLRGELADLELPRAGPGTASPAGSTWRGFVILLISASPGTYVAQADPEREVLTVHRIGARPGGVERSVSR